MWPLLEIPQKSKLLGIRDLQEYHTRQSLLKITTKESLVVRDLHLSRRLSVNVPQYDRVYPLLPWNNCSLVLFSHPLFKTYLFPLVLFDSDCIFVLMLSFMSPFLHTYKEISTYTKTVWACVSFNISVSITWISVHLPHSTQFPLYLQ